MPPRIPPPAASFAVPSPHTICKPCLQRSLSSSPQSQARVQTQTKLRRQMWAWLNTAGKNFEQPQEGHPTNYLGAYNRASKFAERSPPMSESRQRKSGDSSSPDGADAEIVNEADVRPFPLNRMFKSESILSEPLRLEVWKRVQVDNQSVRQVSADLGIDMRRVGAVVRLVEVEKRMRAQGQELALPYAEAVHSMLPVTHYEQGRAPARHESINDLPHHPLTAPQLFYPTSESRAFNRTDAGRVFSAAPRLPDSQDVGQGGAPIAEPWEDTQIEIIGKRGHEMPVLKPADARIPHPHLIKHEQDKLGHEQRDIWQRYNERLEEEQQRRKKAFEKRAERAEAQKTRVDKGKWEFIFTEVQAERGVGNKYGVPSQDRKRGNVKIPTRVEV